MTKKDFELIASVVASLGDPAAQVVVAQAFASRLSSTNPRFNRDRFLRACGIYPGLED